MADKARRGEPSTGGALQPDRLPTLLDRLYRAAWSLCGSPHEAEDLVQETLAKVLARPRLLRRHDELPYLMRALRNAYLTSVRTAARRPCTVELPTDESAKMRSSLAEPEAALERRATLDAIAALPDEFRLTLVAVDVLGLSYCEAAPALRIRERRSCHGCFALASGWPACSTTSPATSRLPLGRGLSTWAGKQPATVGVIGGEDGRCGRKHR